MPAKIITLTPKDQDLLRVALDSAYHFEMSRAHDQSDPRAYQGVMQQADRIKELKERLV
jgi:hypothetical protein